MNDRDHIASRLGGLLVSEEDREIDLTSQRELVSRLTMNGPYRRLRRKQMKILIRAGAGIAAACVALVLYTTSQGSSRIDFRVGDSPTVAQEGHWVRTGKNENTSIRFMGGTRFDFVEQTEARVVEARDHAVTIDLDQGKVRARVTPNQRTRWSVRAGPYKVSVKGTKFSVEWRDLTSVLSVSVERGRVLVQGPGLHDNGVILVAGKSLRAESDLGRVTFEPTKLALNDKAVSVPLAFLPPPEDKRTATTEPPPAQDTKSAKTSHNLPPNWQRLFKDKDYKGAYAAAEQEGVFALTSQLKESDLWMLSNTARYARRSAVAEELLTTYRHRFPRASRAHTAAFLLGKSALENGDNRVAKRWFEVYLMEAPGGPLAEEALGRLVDVYSDLGQSDHARRVAKTYLDRYEGGYFTKRAARALTP